MLSGGDSWENSDLNPLCGSWAFTSWAKYVCKIMFQNLELHNRTYMILIFWKSNHVKSSRCWILWSDSDTPTLRFFLYHFCKERTTWRRVFKWVQHQMYSHRLVNPWAWIWSWEIAYHLGKSCIISCRSTPTHTLPRSRSKILDILLRYCFRLQTTKKLRTWCGLQPLSILSIVWFLTHLCCDMCVPPPCCPSSPLTTFSK